MTDKVTLKRPFQCTWPGCSNSYARSEHLNRHKLNHEPVKIYQCEFCPKTFVRSDLLFRHKDRHAKRAVKKSPPNARLKSIRSARSDSTSSRDEPVYHVTDALSVSGPNYDSLSCSSYSSSVDGNLSRSLSHPRSLLQSPFSSASAGGSAANLNASSAPEMSRYRIRSNTLPLPSMIKAANTFDPCQQSSNFYQHQKDFQSLSVSPILPPIQHSQKDRTYSIESMLNKPSTLQDLFLQEPIIQE